MAYTSKIFQFLISTVLFFAVCISPNDAFAVEYPALPESNIFVIDTAGMISAADEQIINSTSLNLRNEKSIPIVVVTIDSLARYDAADLSIEAYSRALFDHWSIGRSKYNYGMLLIVSKRDRKARIELGADWAGAADKQSQYIMDELIITRFRFDKYSEGVREGVLAMDAMARGQELPSPFYPLWATILIYMIYGGVILGLIATGVSLLKSGKKGWGWAFLGLAFMVLMFLLKALLSRSSGGYSGGGFSGGGSSGGGGATGSW